MSWLSYTKSGVLREGEFMIVHLIMQQMFVAHLLSAASLCSHARNIAMELVEAKLNEKKK